MKKHGAWALEPGETPRHQTGRAGFSLIELLVVIAILVILLALAAGVTFKAVRASQISTEATALADEFSKASLDAVRRNHAVHFRLYRFAGAIEPGAPRVLGYQTLVLDAGASAYVPTGPLRRLSKGTVIHEDPDASTLLGLPEQTPVTTPADGVVTDPELPGIAPYTYYEWQFRPDGSTNLPKDAAWGAVVCSLTDTLASAAVPRDYRAVSINPFTGAVRKY